MTKNTPTVKIIVATHKNMKCLKMQCIFHCMLAEEKQIRMEIRWI